MKETRSSSLLALYQRQRVGAALSTAAGGSRRSELRAASQQPEGSTQRRLSEQLTACRDAPKKQLQANKAFLFSSASPFPAFSSPRSRR